MFRQFSFAMIAVMGAAVCPIQSAPAMQVEKTGDVYETIVGFPVIVPVTIADARDHDPPELPEVDGLEIDSLDPLRRSEAMIDRINNRRVITTRVIYRFRVTPTREGSFTIPPVKIRTDGVTRMTTATRILATKGVTDDLLFVELEADETEIYVGQPLTVRLNIWVRPFRDLKQQKRLTERGMWEQIRFKQSNLGTFQKTLEELAASGRRPGGRSVVRKDSKGVELEYYLYQIETTIYPDRPGQIDGEKIRVVVDYPTRLGRKRSPFGSLLGGPSPFPNDPFFNDPFSMDDPFAHDGLVVVEERPLVGEAGSENPIIVKPVPTADRPEDYRGAVGTFTLEADASPLNVKTGDPVTLRLRIAGDGLLDVVRAPPIEEQSDLISDFRVPDEPLAGIVNGQTKTFTTTIRPVREGSLEIPAIRFSYFDPSLETFVTTLSDPIPINVEASEMLDLKGASGISLMPSRPSSDETPPDPDGGAKTEAFSGLSSLSAADALASVPRARPLTPSVVAVLAAGPMLAIFVFVVRSRSSLGRLIPAKSRLRKELHRAKTAEDIADAVERFFATRFGLSENGQRRDEAIGRLRAEGNTELAIRLERLYAACGQRSTVVEMQVLSDLREQALEVAQVTGDSTSTSRLATPARVATMFVCACLFATEPAWAESVGLSRQQQEQLLAEALPIDSGLSDEARQQRLIQSQSKLQLLVESGIQNDRLFFLLASVAHEAGDVGPAIAYYRKALRLNPMERRYHVALARAESELGSSAPRSGFVSTIERWVPALPPRWWLIGFVGAWSLLWVTVVVRLMGIKFAWRFTVFVASLTMIVTGAAYWTQVGQLLRDDSAVLVADRVTIRSGDGAEFAAVQELTSASGRCVRWIRERGNWLQIELPDGAVGWVRSASAITI